MGEAKRRRDADITRTKVFGGDVDGAERAHVDAMGKRCTVCGIRRAAVALRIFAPREDLETMQLVAIAATSDRPGHLPVMRTPHGLMVRVSESFACRQCQPAAERVAARAPSTWFCDIDRGPDPDRVVVSVGG